MKTDTLYDDDVYAWAHQQATALRMLAATRGLPNELDLANVAEEIEDLGRTEFHRASSFLRLFLIHLLKMSARPDSRSADHWRAELRVFHAELSASFTPSIGCKLDLGLQWSLAVGKARAQLSRRGDAPPVIPDECPLTLEEILPRPPDIDALAAALRASFDPTRREA